MRCSHIHLHFPTPHFLSLTLLSFIHSLLSQCLLYPQSFFLPLLSSCRRQWLLFATPKFSPVFPESSFMRPDSLPSSTRKLSPAAPVSSENILQSCNFHCIFPFRHFYLFLLPVMYIHFFPSVILAQVFPISRQSFTELLLSSYDTYTTYHCTYVYE